ncbi:hypothetical protein BASA81_006210 [Batrachochytrium salamandrivorans]|nr:hypothetical protein BASA81_006210 [Batrachochytrium salamandrivorans]
MSDKSQAATAQASSAAGRAEALQNEADDLRRQIAAFSAQIADLGTRIINLIGMEGKETELAVLVTERTEVEAELAKLEAKLGGAATRGEGLQNGGESFLPPNNVA